MQRKFSPYELSQTPSGRFKKNRDSLKAIPTFERRRLGATPEEIGAYAASLMVSLQTSKHFRFPFNEDSLHALTVAEHAAYRKAMAARFFSFDVPQAISEKLVRFVTMDSDGAVPVPLPRASPACKMHWGRSPFTPPCKTERRAVPPETFFIPSNRCCRPIRASRN